jgi:peroxiredoxin
MVPIPATYVVAPDGRIKASFVEPDFRQRIEPAAILDAI